MTIKTITAIERSASEQMLPALVLADSVSTEVISDTTTKEGDISYIEIFNAGNNNVYYAMGRECDNIHNFNAFLLPSQAMTVLTRQKVCMFAVGGSTVSFTILKRAAL